MHLCQGAQVLGVHVGDTDMSSKLNLPKVGPADVVRQVLGAIETCRNGVLADDVIHQVEAGLSDQPGNLSQLRSGALPCRVGITEPGEKELPPCRLPKSTWSKVATTRRGS